jgi:hypothetical protein
MVQDAELGWAANMCKHILTRHVFGGICWIHGILIAVFQHNMFSIRKTCAFSF